MSAGIALGILKIDFKLNAARSECLSGLSPTAPKSRRNGDAIDLLRHLSSQKLSGSGLDGFKDLLLDGLITHLRSIPLSLRVSESLSLDHPEILELEAAQAEQELLISKETLSERIREITPQEVFDATQAINAAFAIFWAGRLEHPEIANPYRLAGFELQGKALLKIFEEIPNDPINDCELIDRWADYLQIRNFYTWLPYQTP